MGLECENQAEANAAIRTRRSLAEIFKKYPQIRQAWDRGRFLRYLRRMARAGASITEAAKKLGFANGRLLKTMIDEDEVVGEIWNETKNDVFIEIKTALIEAAKEGNLAAAKMVDGFLSDEKERPGFDISRITIFQLSEIVGKARTTILEWYKKFGLPRNADKTFDMSIVWAWREKFLFKKASEGKETAAELDPLKKIKAERLELELKKSRSQMLDRDKVMAGLLARHQIVLFWADRRPDELGRLCHGQKPERIAELIKDSVVELRRDLCHVPEELKLPKAAEEQFLKILESLKSKI